MIGRVIWLALMVAGWRVPVVQGQGQDSRPLMVREPYVQMTNERSAVLVWRTSRPLVPRVVVREEMDGSPITTALPGQIVVRVSEDVVAPKEIPILAGTPAQTFQYEAHINGLSPETRYYYEILDLLDVVSGKTVEHYFTTSPMIGTTRPMRFWTVGDTGDGSPAQMAGFRGLLQFLESEQESKAIDAYVHLGDMAYNDGLDSDFTDNFFGIYHQLLRNTVTWATIGNHEGKTESDGLTGVGPYFDAFVFPTRGEAGGVPSGSEAYYAFDYGDVHFICLDSYDLDRTPAGAMVQWLKTDLEQVNARWLIAFWHHPPYTKGTYDSDDVDGFINIDELVEMRQHIMPILEAAGVDLVLCGHSHTYERSMLIDGAYETPTTADGAIIDDGDGDPDGDGSYLKNQGLAPNNGTVAIVAGHGRGAEHLYGPMTLMRRTLPVTGSVLIDVIGDRLTGRMLDEHGEVRDVFQIAKKQDVEVKRVDYPWQPAGPEIIVSDEPGGSRIALTPVPSAPDSEVRFTIDGSEPTRESELYTSPFFLRSDSVHTVSAVTVWRGGQRVSPAVSRVILADSDDVLRRKTVDLRVANAWNDWYEPAQGDGIAVRSSLNLNLPLGDSGTAALRYSDLMIPDGATILFAQLQFGVGLEESRPARLKIEGELSLSAAELSLEPFATSARKRTKSSVEWIPGGWTLAPGAFGTGTPDLAPLLQEVIDQDGRPAGAAAAFLITGSGVREVLAGEWGVAKAPRLVIQYDERSPLEIASIGSNLSVKVEHLAVAGEQPNVVLSVDYKRLNPGGVPLLDYSIEASATLEPDSWVPLVADLPGSRSQVVGNPWELVNERFSVPTLSREERYLRLRIAAR